MKIFSVKISAGWVCGLLAASIVAEGQAAPPVASATVPAPPLSTLLGFVPLDQPVYGDLLEVLPAHRLAMAEAGRPLVHDDPLVAAAASRLRRLTSSFIEDAGRIAEVVIRMTGKVRDAGRPASPFEIMDGALRWPRPLPPLTAMDRPRGFEDEARGYLDLRIRRNLDHRRALSAMGAALPPPDAGQGPLVLPPR